MSHLTTLNHNIMATYSPSQVLEQRKRFEQLIKSCNLAKAGKIIVRLIIAEGNNRWFDYRFIQRYLELNKICPCMYYKIDPNLFYHDAFKQEALRAYFNSIKQTSLK